jgi:hypothetical protein
LNDPTDQDNIIEKFAIDLMNSVRKSNQAVRLIGVGVSGLGEPIRQLGLWDLDIERSRRLQQAVDTLNEKYGRDVIHKGEYNEDT